MQHLSPIEGYYIIQSEVEEGNLCSKINLPHAPDNIIMPLYKTLVRLHVDTVLVAALEKRHSETGKGAEESD